MMTNKILSCLTLLLSVLVLVSCSDSNSDAPSKSVHFTAWLNPASSDFHGIAATQEGNGSCEKCHGLDLEGSGYMPGCYDCHFDEDGSRIPPGEDWTHGRQQHARYSEYADTCNNCHDTYRSFDQPPAACHDCHPTANHPLGDAWLDKKSVVFHGLDAEQDPEQCTPCHGEDYTGGTTGVGCFECHFGPSGSKVPAGSSWVHSSGHDEDAELPGFALVCNSCHDINRGFGYEPDTCHDCHDGGASHVTGAVWLLPENHAQASIDNRSTCLGCHNMNTGGSGVDPSCRSCHDETSPPLTIGDCSSCHGRPPNSGEHGEHDGTGCVTCHDGYGTGSLDHYYPDPNPPADIKFNLISGDSITYNGDSCTGTCHFGGDKKEHDSGDKW